jgi:hypothetical protein
MESHRASGAVLGSAVGDALGAPFEFGPEGAFSTRFPEPDHGGEMCGGGGWDSGGDRVLRAPGLLSLAARLTDAPHGLREVLTQTADGNGPQTNAIG